MRIAIDATSVPQRPAGAGVYAIELVRALAGMHAGDGYALFTRACAFDPYVSGRRNWRVERIDAGCRQARLLWEQAVLPRRTAALGIDVLHSTHHTLPLRPMRARRVVTIHDVTFFLTPERYTPARRLYMQTMTKLAARVADAIIVPSETVRRDVLRLLRMPASKVRAIHEAAGGRYMPVTAAEASSVAYRYGLAAPYVLSVGSLEPGKNRARLIRAMAALRDEGFEHGLAIVGQPAWTYQQDYALVERLGMSDRVRFLGYVPDEDMPALYNAASVFAFPSLYEGFGLPVLEAMACGTPVITSNVSATAEVAADAAVLVDPLSVEAISAGLRALVSDVGMREGLAARGLARVAGFTWERAARETHAVYAQVARGSSAS